MASSTLFLYPNRTEIMDSPNRFNNTTVLATFFNMSKIERAIFQYELLYYYIDVISVLGILANFLNILAILTTSKLRNSSNALILNLSLLDILIACMALVARLHVFQKLVPEDSCAAVGAISCIALSTSAVNLAAIAVNRYFLVTSGPHVYKKVFSWEKMLGYILLVWVVGIIYNLGPLLGFGKYGYHEKMKFCSFVYRDRPTYWHLLLWTVFGVGGVVVIVSICYVKIYKVLRRLRQQRPGVTLPREAWTVDTVTRLHTIARQDAKLVTSLFFVCCGFCVCWFPLLLTILVDYNFDAPSEAYVSNILLLSTHPVINPLIYLWVNKTYRQAYKRILCCNFACKK